MMTVAAPAAIDQRNIPNELDRVAETLFRMNQQRFPGQVRAIP